MVAKAYSRFYVVYRNILIPVLIVRYKNILIIELTIRRPSGIIAERRVL